MTYSKIPGKHDCYYILEMLKSGLINFKYTEPWADEIINHLVCPPSWICDISTKKYQGDQIKAIREFIFREPFENEPVDLYKFHIACLWLRYERGELSWATFLENTGKYLDAGDGNWDCETPYHYLNIFEDAYFNKRVEEFTKNQYLKDHELGPWIELAKKKFEPFKKLRNFNNYLQ